MPEEERLFSRNLILSWIRKEYGFWDTDDVRGVKIDTAVEDSHHKNMIIINKNPNK